MEKGDDTPDLGRACPGDEWDRETAGLKGLLLDLLLRKRGRRGGMARAKAWISRWVAAGGPSADEGWSRTLGGAAAPYL